MVKAASRAQIPFLPVWDLEPLCAAIVIEMLVLGLDRVWHMKRILVMLMRRLAVYLIFWMMQKGRALTFFMSLYYSIEDAWEGFVCFVFSNGISKVMCIKQILYSFQHSKTLSLSYNVVPLLSINRIFFLAIVLPSTIQRGDNGVLSPNTS